MRRPVVWFGAAAVTGLAMGYAVAKRAQHQHRGALFSLHGPRRRMALGWLEGHASERSVPLLRDYVAWERQPGLRRRAEALLHRLETAGA